MIPKSIKINGTQYSVHITPAKHKRKLGYIDYTPADIYIHDHKPNEMQETFWHELTHAILYEMDSPLYRNETFVTQFSKMLNEAIKTAEL